MSYETAPATSMLATHCAFCSRPLVDAQSVETGVGPICRKKHWVKDAVSPEARAEGNKLIYTIAQFQKGPAVESALARLCELGFAHVVERINKRLRRRLIKLNYEGDRIFLKVPSMGDKFDAYLNACRAIQGRRWEGKELGDSFPMDQKRSVYRLLLSLFSGWAAIGPKGQFIIGAN